MSAFFYVFGNVVFPVCRGGIWPGGILKNISIAEIARIALKATNSEHLEIEFDITKPNGQFRKDLSIEKLKGLMPEFKFTALEDGIEEYYRHYKKQRNQNL